MSRAGTRLRRTDRSRGGAAAAELAFILPVLLLIVLGAVDFGRFAYSYIALTNAARAGAGLGSANPYTTATYSNWQNQVKQAVADEMSQMSGFDGTQLSTTATGVVESGGLWRVEVQSTYPFQTLIPWTGIPQTVNMTRKVVLRSIR